MNIHRRFVVQFFIQLTLIFVLFILILLTLWGILGYSIVNQEIAEDLTTADDYYFSDRISIQENEVLIDEDLKGLVEKQRSWLLVLTEQGKVLGSYHTAEPPPVRLEPGELAALLLQNQSYSLNPWSWNEEPGDSQSYVLVLGKRFTGGQILDQLLPEMNWNANQLNLSSGLLQQLETEQGWVQLMDHSGNVVDSYGADRRPDSYHLSEIRELKEDDRQFAAAYYDEESGLTLLAGLQEESSPLTIEESLQQTVNSRILWLLILLFFLLLSITFWYARKFGYPLVTMMKWIQNLGAGKFEQPLDAQQHPIFLNRNGNLKRKYSMYKDLITTLTQLTETLQQNENERRKITKTREEWISGLSHDLKTPLSSISGYAQMLESDDYNWTKAETNNFAKTISEKSAYMMELLEDLTLTYRLNNQALPIAKEKINLNEFIRRTLIHFINDPANSSMTFTFNPPEEEEIVTADLDPKWFQRVLDNLLANAVKHNAPGTQITVSVSLIEKHLIMITIEDDGEGMDSETLDRLFQRYYRGTHTRESVSGTGLGMAIAKQLVQLHGGSINVKSVPQQGTTVRIFLPVYNEVN